MFGEGTGHGGGGQSDGSRTGAAQSSPLNLGHLGAASLAWRLSSTVIYLISFLGIIENLTATCGNETPFSPFGCSPPAWLCPALWWSSASLGGVWAGTSLPGQIGLLRGCRPQPTSAHIFLFRALFPHISGDIGLPLLHMGWILEFPDRCSHFSFICSASSPTLVR